MQEMRLQRAPSSSGSPAATSASASAFHLSLPSRCKTPPAGNRERDIQQRADAAPRIPAQLLATVGRSGTEERPLTTPTGVSRLAKRDPRHGRSRTSQLQHSAATLPSSSPPRPLSAVAHSQHAIASCLRASVALESPFDLCLARPLGVRPAASPADAPGLPASPPRALRDRNHPPSGSHSVLWPI
jgi:hypothetical protein